jgi:nucleoside-diphosphate-sugar epimerase
MKDDSQPELSRARDQRMADDSIIGPDEPILVTGANGFIGVRLVESLLRLGFRRLRCFVRRSSQTGRLEALAASGASGAQIELVKGNLLSHEDCLAATQGAKVIYHLAAGRGEKSYPDAFMNSVVTTRNLLEATLFDKSLKRFVNVSSFTVYANSGRSQGRLLDETCAVEPQPALRGEAYCFAKVKQDEIVREYGEQHKIPTVVVRPGYVFGPGKKAITGRVGIDSFGVFLHLGGPNRIPFTYVDNCAEAIALAGIKKGIDGEVFNVVDDDLPSSRAFLRLYKRHVRRFRSLYVPHALSYLLCYAWEKYSIWSYEQLPPVFNRRRWNANWKSTTYSNEKVKRLVGWRPRVPMAEALRLYFEGCRSGSEHA